VKTIKQKNGSVVFKVVVLEGKVPETFEASSLFIDTYPQIPGEP